MWVNRNRFAARLVLAGAVGATAAWSWSLLGRTPSWLPWLRPVVAAAGAIGVVGILAWPSSKRSLRRALAASVAVAALSGPFAYTVDTVRTPHSGAIPSAGPAGASAGPGAFPGGRRTGGFGNLAGGSRNPAFPGGTFGGGPAGATGGAGTNSTGGFPGSPGAAPGAGGAAGGGGLLNASKPSAALTRLLAADAGHYTWVAATVGANEAAGYQLATGDPVMAIGGFNGTDPYPTLAYFESLVREGKVHYYISSGSGGGPGVGSSSGSSAIQSWVESHFESTTVGGVAVYDLSQAS
jgi:hypothetical protein